MPTLAMFCGQGSQSPQMAKNLLEQFPYTKALFEEADDTLNIHLTKLCTSAEEAHQLVQTAIQQPAILTTSIAYWTVLKNETHIAPSLFAGHSLGEYSALVASNRITFHDAIKLVRRRGQAMQEAVPEGLGAMAAVMKFDPNSLELLCKKISKEGHRVEIANYNSTEQIIVSGHKLAVEELCEEAKKERAIVKFLPVSAPFHCSLMSKAKETMTPLLLQTTIRASQKPIIPNVSGIITKDYQIENLIQQIDHPVRWYQSMEAALKFPIERAIEIGPGAVLTGLGKRTLSQLKKPILNCVDLKKTISEMSS